MEKIAVFPGSFDPFTVGHESIVLRGLSLFDKIIIAIGENSSKRNLFSVEQRMEMISEIFEDESRITVASYDGLTVDYCKSIGAQFLLRGLRTSADFEFERAIGQVNKMMNTNVETVFLLTSTSHTPITSTIVRDIINHGGDVSQLIPQRLNIKKYL